MRVIDSDDLKDYYDCVSKYDEDRTVIYDRKHKSLKIGMNGKVFDFTKNPTKGDIVPNLFIPEYSLREDAFVSYREFFDKKTNKYIKGFFAACIVIGFCGKIYHAVYHTNSKTIINGKCTENYIFDRDEVEKSFESCYCNNPYFSKKCKNFLEIIDGKCIKKEWFDLFQKFNAPVWLINSRFDYYEEQYTTFEINPILKNYNFMKVKDPMTAWQDLRLYVGGILTNSVKNEPKEIPDEIMRDMKGFDHLSFKRLPSKLEKSEKRRKQTLTDS